MGVLQIGIRAWLQHLVYLGSGMSHLKIMFKVNFKGETLSHYFPKEAG
jgi:hypothetical protein